MGQVQSCIYIISFNSQSPSEANIIIALISYLRRRKVKYYHYLDSECWCQEVSQAHVTLWLC